MTTPALTLYRQGQDLLREGHFGRAAEMLLESVRLDREFLDAYYHLALAYYRGGDPVRAERILSRLAGASPGDVGAHLLLSRVRRALEDRSGAEKALLSVLHHGDLTETEILDLSYELMNVGRRKTALRFLRREVRRHPDNVNLLYRLGRTLGDLGRMRDALKCFDECLQIQPDHADAKRSIDRLLREPVSAKRRWSWLSALFRPKDRLLTGVEKLACGDASGAARVLSRAGDDAEPGLLLALACAYETEGSDDAAIDVLEQIKEDPDVGSFASYRLARLYMNQENHEAASRLLETALDRDPDFEEARDLLAEIFLARPVG